MVKMIRAGYTPEQVATAKEYERRSAEALSRCDFQAFDEIHGEFLTKQREWDAQHAHA